MKPKINISAQMIVGAIFSFTGAIFAAIGILFFAFGDPNDVEGVFDSAEKNFMALCGIFAGMGLLFFVLGIVFVIREVRKHQTERALLEGGYYIFAEVTDICDDEAVTVNRRHPQYAECTYKDPDTQEDYFFRSKDYLRDLRGFLGRNVRVYLERGSFEPYYVDLDSEMMNW